MALHPEFPESLYAVLLPDRRWFPAAEELRSTAYEKLLPPLVAKIRVEVSAWRDRGYAGASETSRALLNWWFETEYLVEQADGTLSPFRYYFAQREAVETVIWLHDVRGVRDKFDLLRFDASGAVSGGMFPGSSNGARMRRARAGRRVGRATASCTSIRPVLRHTDRRISQACSPGSQHTKAKL